MNLPRARVRIIEKNTSMRIITAGFLQRCVRNWTVCLHNIIDLLYAASNWIYISIDDNATHISIEFPQPHSKQNADKVWRTIDLWKNMFRTFIDTFTASVHKNWLPDFLVLKILSTSSYSHTLTVQLQKSKATNFVLPLVFSSLPYVQFLKSKCNKLNFTPSQS